MAAASAEVQLLVSDEGAETNVAPRENDGRVEEKECNELVELRRKIPSCSLEWALDGYALREGDHGVLLHEIYKDVPWLQKEHNLIEVFYCWQRKEPRKILLLFFM